MGSTIAVSLLLVSLLVGVSGKIERRDDDVLELLDLDNVVQGNATNFYTPPAVAAGSLLAPGNISSMNLTEVAHRIYMEDELAFDDEAELDELGSQKTARFGHKLLIPHSLYNYTAVSPCGNGIRDLGEECDDGNSKHGDGCSADCKVEGGFQCHTQSLLSLKGSCQSCAADECTVFYNGAYRCLSTKERKLDGVSKPSAFARGSTGFCECDMQSCMMGPVCLHTREKGQNGWFREEDGTCGCGEGYCLMPMAKGANVGPSNKTCMKLTEDYVREADGTCGCAAAVEAVWSTDPAEARMGSDGACKAYPSKPIEKVRGGQDRFSAFECHRKPYTAPTWGGACTGCEAGACKLERNVGSTPGASGAFTCMDNNTMAAGGYEMAADGRCVCDSNSCLAPDGDGFKCAPIKGGFPYGDVVTADGKCGCAASRNTCIMPTSKHDNGTTNEFLCLDLGTSANPSSYGEKFMRGETGNCQCKSTHCTSDATPSSVGLFDCVDTTRDTTYLKSTKAGQEGKCECNSQCTFPGFAGVPAKCAACPAEPGSCVSHCVGGSDTNRTECLKYCMTKHIKYQLPPARSALEMLPKKDMLARVVECFIWKNVTCTKDAERGWWCLQTLNSRALYNCPARWSPHASRNLPDGTETHGFESVCDRDDLECQLQNCDRNGAIATPTICVDKLIAI